MKTLIKVLVGGLIFFSSSAWAIRPSDVITATPTNKVNNFFVLKTQKEFIGATVEIFRADGELITAQSLERRKVVIDFGSVKYGTYTIRLTKGKKTQEFQFVKR